MQFLESLKTCKGIFTLSEYHAQFLREATNVPVNALYHPTTLPDVLFDYNKFICNEHKKIINIGYWLRKLNSIYQLPVNNVFQKWRLMPYSSARPKEAIDNLIEKERKLFDIKPTKYYDYTTSVERVSNYEYDKLLSENIVFLDLYDSSANNAVIECIARATPILVNPIPAVVEYLGEDYPMYFNTLDQAAHKVNDFHLIKSTHEYLLDSPVRAKLSQQYFRKSFIESEIYQTL